LDRRVLNTLTDEIEAVFKRGFYLSNSGIDCVEELGDLIDAEQCIGVEDERDIDLARTGRPASKERVPCVAEGTAARRTPDAKKIVLRLCTRFTTLRTGSVFPRSLAVPPDAETKRYWSQQY